MPQLHRTNSTNGNQFYQSLLITPTPCIKPKYINQRVSLSPKQTIKNEPSSRYWDCCIYTNRSTKRKISKWKIVTISRKHSAAKGRTAFGETVRKYRIPSGWSIPNAFRVCLTLDITQGSDGKSVGKIWLRAVKTAASRGELGGLSSFRGEIADGAAASVAR